MALTIPNTTFADTELNVRDLYLKITHVDIRFHMAEVVNPNRSANVPKRPTFDMLVTVALYASQRARQLHKAPIKTLTFTPQTMDLDLRPALYKWIKKQTSDSLDLKLAKDI